MKEKMKFYKSFEKVDKIKWSNFLCKHDCANIFQSFEIYNFWKDQKKHNPFIYFFESEDGKCLAFCTGVITYNGALILKAFSKRALIFGGPLLSKELKEEQISYILNIIEQELKNKSIYCEFRNLYDESDLKNIFTNNNWDYLPYLNYIVNLTTEEEVFTRFKNERRRQIRKALREGVSYSYDKTADNIKSVYEVLLDVYINRAKKPLPFLEYFSKLLLLNNAGIVVVNYNHKVIGGGFFLMDDHTIYDWYRGGLDAEFKHQYPSSVADWAIMKYGIQHQKQKFDFMGAGMKGVEYGVRNYKSKFGGELVEYGRFLKINNPLKYKIGKKGLSISKKIVKVKKLKFFSLINI